MVLRVLRRFTVCGAAVTLAACGTGDTSSSGEAESTSTSTSALSAQSAASHTDIAQIREIEDHRLLGDAQLAAFLRSGNPAVRAAAATAVGRIGDASMQTSVATLLGDGSSEVRQAAAFALGLLAGSAAEAALDARFAIESDAATKQAILQALAQAGSVTSVPLVTGALAGQPAIVQGSAAEAYGTMIGNGVAPSTDASIVTEIVALAGQAPEARSIQAAYALARLVGAGVIFEEASLTAAFRSATAPTARAYLTKPIAALGTATSLATVVLASSSDTDERVRAQACSALATIGSSAPVLAALGQALHDSSHAVVVASATAIGTLGTAAASLAPKLESTLASSSSAWVRSAIVPALVDVVPASARSYVVAGLSDAWPVQLAALGALPAVATAADVPTLLDLAAGTDKRLGFAAIEAISALPAALITADVKPAMVAVLARGDWELTVGVSDVAAAFDWTDFAARLSAAYPHFTGDAAMNARLEIVWALGTIGTAAQLPFLQAAIGDDTVLVSQQAAASYQTISGVDVSSQVRTENVVTTATPGPEDVARALASVVVLETTRGTIGIAMLPETPLNAVNFVSLAARGVYDGLPFHRVVPNFVEQGGDPRGDGMGGSGPMVRDELSRDSHLGGTVGLASEGKDTGSSQFFFNEGWNVSLDERYTVFGRIVFGLEAAESLEVGDVIESVDVVGEGLAREGSRPRGGM